MRKVKLTKESTKDILETLLKRSPNNYGKYEDAVADILAKVKAEGDEALFAFTREFDKVEVTKETIRVTPEEIEEAYNRSQEKFLDLGHLQVVILDESMLTEENRKVFLEYLKQEEHVGEDVYMFRTGMLGEVFRWKGAEESSVGEYLQGIQENRTTGQQKKGVTLREVYHQFYQDGTLPWIPSVWVNGDLLEVDYGNRE